MKRLASTIVMTALIGAAGTAQASNPKVEAGQTAMRELNLIVLGDLRMGQEVEGKTWVGGNLSGNGGQFGIGGNQGYVQGTYPTATIVGNVNVGSLQLNSGNVPGVGTVGPRGLTVGGTFTGNLNVNATGSTVKVRSLHNANVNGSNGGTIAYGSRTGSGNLNANGSTIVANDPTLNTAFQQGLQGQNQAMRENLTAFSNHLAGFSADSSLNRSDSNNVKFTATPGADKVAVFTIADAATFFSQAKAFSFNLNGAEGLVINVSNPTALSLLTINQNFLGNASAVSQKIIWNFGSSIQNIHFANSFFGSVLAINSNLSNANYIKGSVAANQFDRNGVGMNGEIHLGTYGGANLAAIPEPATWAMMIGGFGLVGWSMRRRHAVSA